MQVGSGCKEQDACIRIQDAECRLLDVEYRMLDVEYRSLDEVRVRKFTPGVYAGDRFSLQ